MANTPIKLSDGNTITWLGFGAGTALYTKDAEDIVATAIKAGFNHLDGAQLYGNEDSLGKGIIASGKPRSELFVTTKLGRLAPGQTVKESLQESLTKLKLDYVDLFLIHTPTRYFGRFKEIWREFEEVKKEGLAKSIGVSNFRVQDFEEFLGDATIKPVINQIEYHPYVAKQLSSLLEYHEKHGIVTESYGGQSPLFRFTGGPLDPVLAAASERLTKEAGKPVTQGHVLLLWQRQRGIVAVTTSTKESRIQEYIKIADAPDLTADELRAIDEAGAKEYHRQFPLYDPIFED